MKLINIFILSFLALIFSTTSQATVNDSYSDDFCESSYELAYLTMYARQEGVPPSKLMHDLSVERDFADSLIAELANNLVYLAYSQPQYKTFKDKYEASDAFGFDVYMTCMQSFNK